MIYRSHVNWFIVCEFFCAFLKSTSTMADNLKKASNYCVICSSNSKKNPQISFFRFPKDEKRCNEWKLKLHKSKLDNCSAEDCYKRYRVCSAHFEDCMFSSIQKNKLKLNAIPTRLIEVELDSISQPKASVNIPGTSAILQTEIDLKTVPLSSSSSVQNEASDMSLPSTSQEPNCDLSMNWETCLSISCDDDEDNIKDTSSNSDTERNAEDIGAQTSTSLSKNTPRKIHLRNRIRHLRRNSTDRINPANRNISGEEVVEFVKQYCSPSLATFLKAQIEHISKSKKGSWYSNDYKKFALTIYFLGPKFISIYQEFFACLANQQYLESHEIGFNDFIFSTLRIKVEMFLEKNRHCILCMYEMLIISNLFYNIKSDEIFHLFLPF